LTKNNPEEGIHIDMINKPTHERKIDSSASSDQFDESDGENMKDISHISEKIRKLNDAATSIQQAWRDFKNNHPKKSHYKSKQAQKNGLRQEDHPRKSPPINTIGKNNQLGQDDQPFKSLRISDDVNDNLQKPKKNVMKSTDGTTGNSKPNNDTHQKELAGPVAKNGAKVEGFTEKLQTPVIVADIKLASSEASPHMREILSRNELTRLLPRIWVQTT